MKIIKLIFVILLLFLFSCKEKDIPLTVSGHAWNTGENVNFAGAKIVLKEYDNAFEANSKTISTALTDTQGNFSFNFNAKKSKSYSIFIDSEVNNLFISSLLGAELIESVAFKGSNPPSNIQLTATTESFLTFNLIKDLGSDSLFFEYNHQYLNFYYSRMFTNEELQGPDNEIASGNWIYKKTRYLGGTPTVSIDTHYLAPNQHQVIDVHY